MILRMIVVKLNELLESRKISLNRVQKDTGIAYTTLLKLSHNENKKIDLRVLETLCSYLNCDIADLLTISKDQTV